MRWSSHGAPPFQATGRLRYGPQACLARTAVHHPPLRSRLVADLFPPEFPLPSGMLRVRAYGNQFDLFVIITCAGPYGDTDESAKAFECVDVGLCRRMVARWMSARAMRLGTESPAALAWANSLAAEMLRRWSPDHDTAAE